MKNNKRESKAAVLYEETAVVGRFWLVVAAVALVLMVASLVYAWRSVAGPKNLLVYLPPLLVIILFIFTVWNFLILKIRITTQTLELKFGFLFGAIIQRRQIIDCSATETRFRNYLSVGMRPGLDGSRGYISWFGSAVRVERRNEKPLVFSSKAPDEVCSVLQGLANSTPVNIVDHPGRGKGAARSRGRRR